MKNFMYSLVSLICLIFSTCVLIRPIEWDLVDIILRYIAMGLWLTSFLVLFYKVVVFFEK